MNKKRVAVIAAAAVLTTSMITGVLALNESLKSRLPNQQIKDKLQQTANIDMGDDFLLGNALPEKSNNENAALALDNNDRTVCRVRAGDIIQVDFKNPTSVNNIHLKEDGSIIRGFHVEAWNGKEWVKIYNSDVMDTYHLAVFDTVKTYALRVVVDEINGNGESGIATIEAVHQRQVNYSEEFLNVGYIPSDTFQKGYNVPDKKLMDTFSDVIMINSFRGDDLGDFVIIQDATDDGSQQSKLITYKTEKAEADAAVERWIKNVKDMMGSKQPRMWMSVMMLAWGDHEVSSGETAVYNDDAVRTAFIKDVVAYAKEHGFYGIDFDWEGAKTSDDWAAYNKMCADLVAAAHKEGIKVSTAQSMWWPQVDKKILATFDRIGIMGYDSFGTDANHSAFIQAGVNAIDLFHNQYGIPREKLVLGLPWYANFLNDTGTDINWNRGQIGWKDAYKDLLLASEDQETIDEGLNRYTKGNKDYTFNGPNMIRSKVVLAAKNKLGGVFCWAAHADIEYDSPYSLGRVTSETIQDYVLNR